LAVLDYLSDYVCVLYGAPGAYGVVTMPFSVRMGINAFLAGFIPTENLRFRQEALSFKVRGFLDVTWFGRNWASVILLFFFSLGLGTCRNW
jgi:translation initiation factor RLI1